MKKYWQFLADVSIIGAPIVGLFGILANNLDATDLGENLHRLAASMAILGLYTFYIPVRFGSAVTLEEPK